MSQNSGNCVPPRQPLVALSHAELDQAIGRRFIPPIESPLNLAQCREIRVSYTIFINRYELTISDLPIARARQRHTRDDLDYPPRLTARAPAHRRHRRTRSPPPMGRGPPHMRPRTPPQTTT